MYPLPNSTYLGLPHRSEYAFAGTVEAAGPAVTAYRPNAYHRWTVAELYRLALNLIGQGRLLSRRPLSGGYPYAYVEGSDAAFIVGQHAKSNTDGGHLAHSGSFAIQDVTINGLSVGELGVLMLA